MIEDVLTSTSASRELTLRLISMAQGGTTPIEIMFDNQPVSINVTPLRHKWSNKLGGYILAKTVR